MSCNLVGSFNKGVLWLGRGLAESYYRDEFVQSASCAGIAGITCISQMSAKAMDAMWTNAKVTNWKSQKILEHLFDWFKKLITAQELDVDAFGTTP
jgi:hypothetical protein